MNGYVRNKTAVWRHAMKRSIGPGHRIELDDLYEQYGTKHDLEEGPMFVEWLRTVKLSDSEIWQVVSKEEPKEELKEEPKEEKPEVVEAVKLAELTTPLVKKDLEVADVVGMPVRTARTALQKITNLKLLKYALTEANQLSNKDTLCLLLRKRIQVLEITRR